MSFLSMVGGFFKRLGSVMVTALGFANVRGLTDEVVYVALDYVKLVAARQIDNAAKRELVVDKVSQVTKLPESVVRLAVELAYQVYKRSSVA